eukprot:TRINITY_DN27443_c0_g2_i1.p1 TRINITY_DN27443_c0_g2~~TRINITY_DN27443_c0_g2_i1.p1  ORF type:complete len:540 (+),score=97.93 TRINITY_DN27443_c0_g2_i1:245-1864(+)
MAVRVSLKNTFLTFSEEGEDAPPRRVVGSKAASPRSRSLECSSPRSPEGDENAYGLQIERLNRLLEEVGSGSASRRASPSPLNSSSPREVSIAGRTGDKNSGPSAEEMEQLQHKLEKVCQPEAKPMFPRAFSSMSLQSSASTGDVQEAANFDFGDGIDGQELEFDLLIEEIPSDHKPRSPVARHSTAPAAISSPGPLPAGATAAPQQQPQPQQPGVVAKPLSVGPVPASMGPARGRAHTAMTGGTSSGAASPGSSSPGGAPRTRKGSGSSSGHGKGSQAQVALAAPVPPGCWQRPGPLAAPAAGGYGSPSPAAAIAAAAGVADFAAAHAAQGAGAPRSAGYVAKQDARNSSPASASSPVPGSSREASPKASPKSSPRPGWHGGKDYRHGHVPKTVDLAEESTKKATDAPPTTVMIRNIPNRYTQRDLISELEDLEFAGTFDFVYIPLDKGTMSNVGYAFVNFIAPSHCARCMEVMQRYHFKRYRRMSGRVAAVSVAHIQGLEANLAHYENAAVNNAKLKQFRPIVMANISKSILASLDQ